MFKSFTLLAVLLMSVSSSRNLYWCHFSIWNGSLANINNTNRLILCFVTWIMDGELGPNWFSLFFCSRVLKFREHIRNHESCKVPMIVLSSLRTRNALGWKFLRNCLSLLSSNFSLDTQNSFPAKTCQELEMNLGSEGLKLDGAWIYFLFGLSLPGTFVCSHVDDLLPLSYACGSVWYFIFACNNVDSPLCPVEYTGLWRSLLVIST